MVRSFWQKLNSRKLWLALGLAIFVTLNSQLGWGIPEDTVNLIFKIIAGWVGVEGAADIVSRYVNK